MPAHPPRNAAAQQQPHATVAVIGAGLAGMSCARHLRDAGIAVHVFEKSRGIGGRLAQRRLADASFDLGAQYFTASDPLFVRQLQRWQHSGDVQRWSPRLATWRSGQLALLEDAVQRWVGVPAMNRLARSLSADIDVFLDVRVAPLAAKPAGQPWTLHDTEGRVFGRYAAVLCTTPAEQCAELCVELPQAAAVAQRVSLTPCFALGLKLPAEHESGSFDGIFADGRVLSWIARDGSKAGREHPGTWMVHAAPGWSAEHLERALPWIEEQLLQAFFEQTQTRPTTPELRTLHRWRYAQAERAEQTGFWLDTDATLGIAGDWLCGNRVEGAWCSGQRLAARILEAWTHKSVQDAE